MASIPKRASLPRFVRALVVGFIAAVSLVACGPSQPPPVTTSVQVNTEVPQWIFQSKPQHNKIAVVFVHGLFGGTLDTWTNANGKTFFELLKGAPEIGDKVDIFAFGFTSKMLAEGSLDIRQAATKLDQWLINQDVWGYDTVVFVAHSMGGLVVMQEVLDHPEKHGQIPLVMLYAVPQEGAQVAAIARLLSGNPALKQMFPANESDFLQGLDHSWSLLETTTRPTVICAYETASVQGIPIVSPFSATRYCNDAKVAIGGANHISIVKPDGPNHDSVITIENALHKYVFGTNRQSLLEMPDFTPEGDALVYNFSDLLADNTARFVNNSPRPLRLTLGNTSDPKLSINPSKSPRDIASQQIDEIKIELLFRGTWQKEYRFTVSAPAIPARTVVVRLADLGKIESQALSLSEEVKGAVRDLQTTPQFRLLGSAQQQEEAARVGRNVLLQKMPHVSPGLDWALTADALSTAGFKDYAVSALVKTTNTSAVTSSPSVIFLTKSISEDIAPKEKYNRDRLEVLMRNQVHVMNDERIELQPPPPPEINRDHSERDKLRNEQLRKDEAHPAQPARDKLEKERLQRERHG